LNTAFSGIELAQKHADITKNLLKIRSWNLRKGVVSSIKAKCSVRNDPFDLKPHLFGFKNGVYDLKLMEFRAGVPNDMVSKIADYDFAPERDRGKRVEMMRILNQIMPMEDERDYLLTAMSSGLFGRTVQNMFILTGEGGNGKDMLMSKLYRDCVGRDHYNYSNTSILTEKRKSELCQGIANMHKKRVVVWSEPPKNAIIQGAVVKELTGVDEVSARGLYSTNTCTIVMMSGFMLCNVIPRMDSVDGGILRRTVVIMFRSLFKDSEEMLTMVNVKHVYKKDGNLDTNEFREGYKLTLFHILLDYFKIFKENDHMMPVAPKSIRDASMRYIEDSDEFMTWFNEVYEKTEEEHACVQVKDVYAQYKMSDLYQNLNKSEKRGMNLKTLIERVEKNPTLRVCYTERYKYYVGPKQKEIRNAIVGYHVKPIENEDADSENED
jgi:phage/plasmid-associated DNA primase